MSNYCIWRNALRLLTPHGLCWLALALALSSMAGCSAVRLGYNQADHLVYWWLDGYVDFNDLQKPRAREGLMQLFAWHRQTQLPQYVNLLATSRDLVAKDTTAERTCALWTEIRGYMDSTFEHALPMAAEIMLTLTPQQIQNIERRYAKVNAEFDDEHLKGDTAKRLKKSIKRTAERAEFFYGKLDQAQQDFIANGVTLSPYEVNIWNAERHRRQQDIVQVLRRMNADGVSQSKAQAALRAYMERVYRSPDDNYRKYADQLWSYNCVLVSNLHNLTTPAQREHAANKIKGWESDIRLLLPPAKTARLGSSLARGLP